MNWLEFFWKLEEVKKSIKPCYTLCGAIEKMYRKSRFANTFLEFVAWALGMHNISSRSWISVDFFIGNCDVLLQNFMKKKYIF